VALKPGNGHQTWLEFSDHNQGCSHAKFKRPYNVQEKANAYFLPNQTKSVVSSECIRKRKTAVYSSCRSPLHGKNSGVFILSIATTWYSHEPAEVKFKIHRIRTYFLKLLKLFDTVVLLKYGQCHSNWYEQVKPNKLSCKV